MCEVVGQTSCLKVKNKALMGQTLGPTGQPKYAVVPLGYSSFKRRRFGALQCRDHGQNVQEMFKSTPQDKTTGAFLCVPQFPA